MKSPRFAPAAVLAALLAAVWLAGCGPQTPPPPPAPPAPPQVPVDGRSAVSAAIANHLEYGGEFFAVVDIQGDLNLWGNRYADVIHNVLQSVPGNPRANLDIHALFERLGLYGIAGGGLSSWCAAGDVFYHNRAFLYVPQGRQGVLKVFGGAPVPFLAPQLAPIDTDLAFESTLDLKSLADLVLAYVREVAGPDALEQALAQLKQPLLPAANVSLQEILQHGDTRIVLLARADSTHATRYNGLTFPHVDFLLGLDGFADVFDQLSPLLATMANLSVQDGIKTATLSFPLPANFVGYQPELLADPQTKRLYLVSRPEFANVTVFGQGPRLALSNDYHAATTDLPATGNALSYVSKNGLDALIKVYSSALTQLPQQAQISISQTAFAGLENLPHGLAGTRVNLPDGILAQSFAPQSNKTAVLVGPVFAVGIMSAMAIPAFNKVRLQSREKAMTNNLRQLASAGQQYMLDKGVTKATYQDLVGPGTDQYIRSISPVDGEDYHDTVIYQTTTQISISTPDGLDVTYNL